MRESKGARVRESRGHGCRKARGTDAGKHVVWMHTSEEQGWKEIEMGAIIQCALVQCLLCEMS